MYVFGRMLFLVERPVIKNGIAAGIMAIYAVCCVMKWIPSEVNDIVMIFTGGAILYVLVGFRLFNRFNRYQDARFGNGEEDYKALNKKKKG